MAKPLVIVLMGSKSDWETMQNAAATLAEFGVEHESRVLSAHRTPKETTEYVSKAESRGVEVVIAAAGGAAHLAGVCAAHTTLPVLGVPMTSALNGLDSLLSTVQMPGGIPVGTLAVGKAGATNAAALRCPAGRSGADRRHGHRVGRSCLSTIWCQAYLVTALAAPIRQRVGYCLSQTTTLLTFCP